MKVSIEISKQDMQYLYEVAENAEQTEYRNERNAEKSLNDLKGKKDATEDEILVAKNKLRIAQHHRFIACLFLNVVYDALYGEDEK